MIANIIIGISCLTCGALCGMIWNTHMFLTAYKYNKEWLLKRLEMEIPTHEE